MKNYCGLVSLPILIKKPIVKFNRLKKLPCIVLLFFSVVHLIYAQENTLLIQTSSKQDSIVLSEINYQKQFPDANSLNLELDSVLNQVQLLGFIEALWIDKRKKLYTFFSDRPQSRCTSEQYRRGSRGEAHYLHYATQLWGTHIQNTSAHRTSSQGNGGRTSDGI